MIENERRWFKMPRAKLNKPIQTKTWVIFLMLVTLYVFQKNMLSLNSEGGWINNNYEWQIETWVKAANSGNFSSNHEIATKVFGKPEPRSDLRDKITYPFLSHDTIRAFLDWEFDHKRNKFIPGPSKIGENFILQDGDSIAVNSEFIDRFVAMKIKTSFILITVESDTPPNHNGVGDQLLKSPLLISWFAENCDLIHPKLKALPKGLQDRKLGKLGDPNKLLKLVKPFVPIFSPKRTILSYINFTPWPQVPARVLALAVLSNISQVADQRISIENYVKDLKISRFTVSPPGQGWDCYRTWEAILFGSVPIVLYSSSFSHLYEINPVMVVRSWSEVTREKLEMFKVKKIGRDAVFVDFWLQQIQDDKQKWKDEQIRQPLV